MTIKFHEILKNRHCLVIDDQVDSRSAIKKYLEGFGVKEVTTANDGDQATNLIAENEYDLIICDYNLGKGKDGQQVLEESRYTNNLKNTCCFIIVTAENAKDMVMGAIENQPDDYISKPYNSKVFQDRLKRALTVKDMLKDINHYIDEKDFDKAIEICRGLLKTKTPIKIKLIRILARELQRTDRHKEALEIYESILEEHDIHWARLGAAKSYYGLGDYDSSMEILEDTVKAYPDYVQCYDVMADISLKEGAPKQAESYLLKAVKKAPKSVLRQMQLGQIAFKNKSMEVAEEAFKEATRIGKHSCYITVNTFLNYVKTLQRKIVDENTRESNQAVTDATKATEFLRERYHDEQSYVFESEILDSITYQNRGMEEEAKAAVTRAEKVLVDVGDKVESSQKVTLLEALVNTHQTDKAKHLITDLEQEQKLKDRDKRRLNRAIEENEIFVNRKSPEELNQDAIMYYKEGKFRKAMIIFDQAAKEKEATDSVLLNAIQAKISLMEDEEPYDFMVVEVEKYIRRLGFIGPKNPRRKRLVELKKRLSVLEKKLKGVKKQTW